MSEISSHLPDVADRYAEVRAQRLEKEKEVQALQEQETLLQKHLIAELRAQGMGAIGGHRSLVKLHEHVEPDATDWDALRTYIQETGAFDLLHQRVTNTAVKERWDAGVEVPGVGRKTVYKISVSKL